MVLDELRLEDRPADLRRTGSEMLRRKAARRTDTVYLALVCAYPGFAQRVSLCCWRRLQHAGTAEGVKVDVATISAEDLDDDTAGQMLAAFDAFILPGGYETRGAEGMMIAARSLRGRTRYADTCDRAGNAAGDCGKRRRTCWGFKDANSTEVDPATPHPVVYLPAGSQPGTARDAPKLRMGGA